jgi:hypothetical protein
MSEPTPYQSLVFSDFVAVAKEDTCGMWNGHIVPSVFEPKRNLNAEINKKSVSCAGNCY